MVLYRLECHAIIHRAARHRVHVLEVKAQLVHRPQLQRRDRHVRFTVNQPLQYRQTQQQAIAFLGAVQAERLQELIVQADIHTRAVFAWRRGVTVVEIHINTVAAQQIEIRRQIQRNRRRFQPGGLELLFIGFQLAERHRTVSTYPVRRIIRFTRQQRLHLIHHHAVATEQDIPLRNAFRRLQQIVIVAAKDHQQLHIWVVRVADHLNHRRFYRRMIAQEIRALVVRGKDDGITIRQRVVHHREMLAAPACARTEP